MSTVAALAMPSPTVTVFCHLPHGFRLSLPDRLNGECWVALGHGDTAGIPKDFWIEWCRRNKDSLLLTDRIIFARPE